jgi:hypothetical protein
VTLFLVEPARIRSLGLILLLGLSACSFANDMLVPSLTGEDPRGVSATAPPPAGVSVASTASAVPESAAPAAPARGGGTPGQLGADLDRLRGELAQRQRDLEAARGRLANSTNTVDGLINGLEARRPSGSVPDDPRLSGEWSQAQTELGRMSEEVNRLAAISIGTASDGTLASYIIQAARAQALQPGTSDADRRQLAGIEAEANRASGNVDNLISRTTGEISARNLYLTASHRRLAALAPTGGAPRGPAATTTVAGAPAGAGRRPLVTIHFDRPDVAFADQLYGIVSQVLDRRPDAAFDLVAVTPAGGDPSGAQHNMEQVVHSLTEMGLPADRMRLSARTRPDVTGNEVRVYLR